MKKEIALITLAVLAVDVVVYFVASELGAPRPLRVVTVANLCLTAVFILATVVHLPRIR